MEFKKNIIIKTIIGLIIVYIISRYMFFKKSEISNLNIIANPPNYEFIIGSDQKFKKVLKKENLEKIFKVDNPNILYEKQKWNGRIRLNEISYHALFTIDNSATKYKIKGTDLKGLNFKIFNPQKSKLIYTIDIIVNGEKKQIFKKQIHKKLLYSGDITFPNNITGNMSIVFRSKGSGPGAWINPRLLKKKKKRNIVVVIVVDTLRYDHTSISGYHKKTTPFLEELAKDSVLYESAFSTTSWTLPAHVSLFTGKNITEHGVISPKDHISQDHILLAEVFQRKSYVTAAFTGGGFVEDSYGFYRGFQYYSNVPGDVFSMNSASRVFSHFKKYISRFLDEDIFVFLHTYQVHAPYKAPHEFIRRINKKVKNNLLGISNFIKEKKHYYKNIDKNKKQLLIDLYDASILYTDEVLIGNVINYLKKNNYYQNATIAVLSDHGEEFFDHGSWEHGHTLYNELVRIPLLIKYPRNTFENSNKIFKNAISITDISGLILKAKGLKKTVGNNFPIRSERSDQLIPVMLPVSPIIKQFSSKISFIKNKFHFIYNLPKRNNPVFFDPQPLVKSKYELYNFVDDIKERKNIYKKNKVIFKELRNNIKIYLDRLSKIMKKQKKAIDKGLKKKLESLGYLGK